MNNRHESLGDNYKYLDLNINEQLMRNRASLLSNDQDFKKYMDFLGQEIMYANYSLARIQRIEEKISQEYFTMINSFNIQPMLYDNWSYYSKDPRLTSKSMFDIYRVPISPNTVKTIGLLSEKLSSFFIARRKTNKRDRYSSKRRGMCSKNRRNHGFLE